MGIMGNKSGKWGRGGKPMDVGGRENPSGRIGHKWRGGG